MAGYLVTSLDARERFADREQARVAYLREVRAGRPVAAEGPDLNLSFAPTPWAYAPNARPARRGRSPRHLDQVA